MHLLRIAGPCLGLLFGFPFEVAGSSAAQAAAGDYRFELVGKPQAVAGKDLVRVRLVRVRDNSPVRDAVVFEMKADMGPAGMASMTAPIKTIPSTEPGVYLFEIAPDMAGKWAIMLAAKVQGESETVRGVVIADLVK